MTITFTQPAKQRIWQLINRSLADADDPHCPYCNQPMSAKNFAGATVVNDELRAFDGNITCLMKLVNTLKEYEP